MRYFSNYTEYTRRKVRCNGNRSKHATAIKDDWCTFPGLLSSCRQCGYPNNSIVLT